MRGWSADSAADAGRPPYKGGDGRAVAPRPPLSPESHAVLDAARALYREFYANITHTPWMDWRIETWDVGYYQVRNAMKGLAAVAGRPPYRDGGHAGCVTLPDAAERVPPAEALRTAHDVLRAKLLPKVYSHGLLNPDVVYFE